MELPAGSGVGVCAKLVDPNNIEAIADDATTNAMWITLAGLFGLSANGNTPKYSKSLGYMELDQLSARIRL